MRKILTVVVCLSLFIVPYQINAKQGQIEIIPANDRIMKGEILKVDIRARDLENVYALSFEIDYEAQVLNYNDFEWGSFIKTETELIKDCTKVNSEKLAVTVSHIDGKSLLPSGVKTIVSFYFEGITPSKESPLKVEKVFARTKAFERIELSTQDAEVEVFSPPTKPELVVEPKELDFGTLQFGQSQTLSINISNTGKEGLKGSTECLNSWLSAEPLTFDGDEIEIKLTAEPPEFGLRVNKTYKGVCSIFSNGGSTEVKCRFYFQEKGIEEVIPPDLTIDEPKDGLITNESMIMIKGRTNPGVNLKINRMPREIAPDGSFEHELMLIEGDNEIVITAQNEKGGISNKVIHCTLDTIKPLLFVDEPDDVVHTRNLVVKGISEPGVTIKTGGKPIETDESGEFRVVFQLDPGNNNISIVAVDKAGNTTSWSKSFHLVEQETIKVMMWIGKPEAYVNGQVTYLTVPPTIKNGRTFVPVRFVSESLKSEVKWDGDTRSVTIVGAKHTSIVMIDSETAFIDGQIVKLDAAPFIENSTTLVPLRFVAQDTLEGEIEWDGEEKRIDISVTFDISE